MLAVRCALCDPSQARELIVARVRRCADVHAEGLMTALEAHLEQLEMHYRVRYRECRLPDLVDCSSPSTSSIRERHCTAHFLCSATERPTDSPTNV